MFVLIEYNEFYSENLKKCQEFNLIPIIMFKIILRDKVQIKKGIEELNQLKSKLSPKFSAVQISLEKIENSTIGTVNNMKNNFDIVIGLGGLNKVNRFFLESCQIDFLQDPQNTLFLGKMDFIHHFNSGLNHILCKIAKEKNIGLISTLNFSYGKKFYIPKEIGRINQNLKFARKYGIPSIINFIVKFPTQIKTIVELKGIMSFFDLSPIQKKESFEILEKKIKENKFKNSEKYISRGIKIIR